MDSSGNIYTPEQAAALRDAGDSLARDLVPIPDESLDGVLRMNRKARRKWYAEQRRALRRAAKAGS